MTTKVVLQNNAFRETIMRRQEDKQSKPAFFSLPHQDDCKTRMDIK